MRTNLFASLLFLFIASCAFGQITTNTNFDPRTNQPVDVRDTLTFLADTSEVTWTFPGLISYAADVDQFWYYNGSYWERVVQDPFLANLQDVDTADIATDDFLQWNGTSWVPSALPQDIVEGIGLVNYLAFWDTDTTITDANISYSLTILDASGLTGALVLPSGTDAQDPIWQNGMLRYNTTTGGFQGYNGAELYLPWSASPSFTSGSVIFSDGNRIVEDNSGLYFDAANNELRINSSADAGNYGLQVWNKDIWLDEGLVGNVSAGIRMTSVSRAIESGFPYQLHNSNSANGAIETRSYQAGLYAMSYNDSDPDGIIITAMDAGANGQPIDQIMNAIDLTTRRSWASSLQNNNYVTSSGGIAINWKFRFQSDSTNAMRTAGKIYFMNTEDTYQEDSRFVMQGLDDLSLQTFFDATKGQIKFPYYGSGAITGTPTYWSAWDANGRFIETTAADIVAAALPETAYGEWYQDTSSYATVIIDTANVPRIVSRAEIGEILNATVNDARITYDGADTARFLVNYSCEVTTTVSGAQLTMWVYKNGSPVLKARSREYVESTGTSETMATNCVLEMAQNDYIEVFYASDKVCDIFIKSGNLSMTKL